MKSVLERVQLARKLGWKRVGQYLSHRAKVKSGWYRLKTPVHEWGTIRPSYLFGARSPFAVPPQGLLRTFASAKVAETADRILGGEACYFFHHWMERPKSWHCQPRSGFIDDKKHWSELEDFIAARGDVKWTWDQGRFPWLFPLTRAWVQTQDDKYLLHALFLLEDWRTQNWPNRGIHWKCAQECSFRLLSLVWFLGVTSQSTLVSDLQRQDLWEMVCELANRIEPSLDYSLAQNNNHGLSEALALYVAGSSLIAHPKAKHWKALGYEHYLRQSQEQFSVNGSYVQHSFIYQRLALQLSWFFLTNARAQGDKIPAGYLQRISDSAKFLFSLQDTESGRLPNYGANDGSDLIPLHDHDYLDFRPVIAMVGALTDQVRVYPGALYDEFLLWTCGDKARWFGWGNWKKENHWLSDGYGVIRKQNGFGFVRAPAYQTRPSQSDVFHFDLWWQGKNILIDPGTYQYFDERDWGSYLKSAEAHNVLTLRSHPPMRSAGRFLWKDWAQANTLQFETASREEGPVSIWKGEFRYRLSEKQWVVQKRTITGASHQWQIEDEISGSDGQPHEFTLAWNLSADLDWRLEEERLLVSNQGHRLEILGATQLGTRLLRGIEHLPRTGRSLYYGAMEPMLRWEVTGSSVLPIKVTTRVTLPGNQLAEGMTQQAIVAPRRSEILPVH